MTADAGALHSSSLTESFPCARQYKSTYINALNKSVLGYMGATLTRAFNLLKNVVFFFYALLLQ